ncbi:MAG: recombination mediator RecR [Christensenellales bacterium]
MISNDFDKLVNSFTKLPTVGMRSAERFAYSIINMNKEDVGNLVKNILQVKNNIKICKICGNFTTNEICDICETRKSDIICVVKEAKDILNFEKIKNFNCLYHVLGGTLSPMKNISPNDLNITTLLNRINEGNVSEIILALNADVEGEATSMYLTKLLAPFDIKVSRLAQGISLGTELEYVDQATLLKAVQDRKIVNK